MVGLAISDWLTTAIKEVEENTVRFRAGFVRTPYYAAKKGVEFISIYFDTYPNADNVRLEIPAISEGMGRKGWVEKKVKVIIEVKKTVFMGFLAKFEAQKIGGLYQEFLNKICKIKKM